MNTAIEQVIKISGRDARRGVAASMNLQVAMAPSADSGEWVCLAGPYNLASVVDQGFLLSLLLDLKSSRALMVCRCELEGWVQVWRGRGECRLMEDVRAEEMLEARRTGM